MAPIHDITASRKATQHYDATDGDRHGIATRVAGGSTFRPETTQGTRRVSATCIVASARNSPKLALACVKNCTPPTRISRPQARSTTPNAAVVFPLPWPVETMSSPFCVRAVRAARRRAIASGVEPSYVPAGACSVSSASPLWSGA